MEIKYNKIEKILWNIYVQHILFWIFSYYFLYRLFAYSEGVEIVDLIYTFLFHLSLVVVVYTNIWILIPRFLQNRNYSFYFLGLGIIVLIGVFINMATFNWLADVIFPNYYFIDYYGFTDILEFIVAYVFISSLLKFSKSWFREMETDKKINLLEKEKLDAEINALKGQINPHFLFNSLNNLYSLSLDNDKRVPNIILRLSEMMRYLLYDTNVEKVPLLKEIEHLKNYIEMHELRVGAKVDIKMEINGAVGLKKITPLLFLPLVENAFKHGEKGNEMEAFVHITMDCLDNEIVFKLSNKKGEVDELFNKKSGGVGLDNLQKRLKLAYPEKHEFVVADGVEDFTAVLKIKL